MPAHGGRGWFSFVDRVGLALVLSVAVALASVIALQKTAFWSRAVQPSLTGLREDDPMAFLARHGILVPLRQDLGSSHWQVATRDLLAQRYFDQGLRWVVGYNFKLALASFLQSETLDPACAMCAWGEAVCRGQNLNEFMDLSTDNVRRASDAVERAAALNAKARASPYSVPGDLAVEEDLIEAMRLRFGREPKDMALGAPRTALNEAYADSMQQVAQKHSDNNWVLFFAADAQMNTMPWNYWEEMLPAGSGKTLRPRLERAREYLATLLQREPKHAGALHLQLHLFEAAHDVGKALDASKRLEALHIRGSEHLLHMPSHGFLRAGDYLRSVRANIEATAVLSEHAYPQHNVEFIVYSYTALRMAQPSIEAAFKLHSLAENLLLTTGRDGYEAIFPYERFVVAPLYTCVVFRNWSCVEERTSGSPPPLRRLFEGVFWHWARGHLLASRGKADEAERQLGELRAAAKQLDEAANVARYSAELYPARQIARVIGLFLEASVAKARGREHLSLLKEAAEVPFYYDEPPSLFFPAEIVYGMEAQDEGVLQEALKSHRSNQWIAGGGDKATFI